MHHYAITVKENGTQREDAKTLVFETDLHDDLFAIMEKMRAGNVAPEEDIPGLALGLKLFGGALKKRADHPAFAALGPHFGAFMKALKKTS